MLLFCKPWYCYCRFAYFLISLFILHACVSWIINFFVIRFLPSVLLSCFLIATVFLATFPVLYMFTFHIPKHNLLLFGWGLSLSFCGTIQIFAFWISHIMDLVYNQDICSNVLPTWPALNPCETLSAFCASKCEIMCVHSVPSTVGEFLDTWHSQRWHANICCTPNWIAGRWWTGGSWPLLSEQGDHLLLALTLTLGLP